MDNKGYVRLPRDLHKSFSSVAEYGAFCYLLTRAAHNDSEKCPRGSIITALRALAKRWGWSDKRVKTFLTKTCFALLEAVIDKDGVRITIRHFDAYDGFYVQDKTQTSQSTHTFKKEEKNKEYTVGFGTDEELMADAKYPYEEILSDLRKASGKNFRDCANTRRMIRARFRGGATYEEFLLIHAYFHHRWFADPKWRRYIQPSTLYQCAKWNDRVVQAEHWKRTYTPPPVRESDDMPEQEYVPSLSLDEIIQGAARKVEDGIEKAA